VGSVGSIGFVCSAGGPSMSVKLSTTVNHGPSMLASLRDSAFKISVAYFLLSSTTTIKGEQPLCQFRVCSETADTQQEELGRICPVGTRVA